MTLIPLRVIFIPIQQNSKHKGLIVEVLSKIVNIESLFPKWNNLDTIKALLQRNINKLWKSSCCVKKNYILCSDCVRCVLPDFKFIILSYFVPYLIMVLMIFPKY